MVGKFGVFHTKHRTRFEVSDGVERGTVTSIADFNGDRYNANANIDGRENFLSTDPRAVLDLQGVFSILYGYTREIVSAASFDAIKYQTPQSQNFDNELRVSDMLFQALPKMAKIVACVFGALIFLALGLVHIHSIAPARNVLPL